MEIFALGKSTPEPKLLRKLLTNKPLLISKPTSSFPTKTHTLSPTPSSNHQTLSPKFTTPAPLSHKPSPCISPHRSFTPSFSTKKQSHLPSEVLTNLEAKFLKFRLQELKDSISQSNLKKKVKEWAQLKNRLQEEFQIKQEFKKRLKRTQRVISEIDSDTGSHAEYDYFTSRIGVLRKRHSKLLKISEKVENNPEQLIYQWPSRELDVEDKGKTVNEAFRVKLALAKRRIRCDLVDIAEGYLGFLPLNSDRLPNGGETLLKLNFDKK